MIRNYLVVALRSISRFRLYAGLNIAGLAVGLACFVTIFLFVDFELSYDRFHTNADRIHRVVQRQPGNAFLGTDHFAVTPAPLGEAAVAELPEVQSASTLTRQRSLLIADDQTFLEDGLRADDGFFEMFSFDLLEGRAGDVLDEPRSMVLTSSLAAKLFPNEEPLGAVVHVQNEGDYTVTGIAADPPPFSHLQFAFVTTLVSFDRYQTALTDGWDNNSWFTYLLLREDADPATMDAKVDAMAARKRAETGDAANSEFYIQPLTDIHLHSNVNFEISQNGSARYVYLFGAIGIVILLLACINYTNLAVARSLRRAREVGMRKAVGAHRRQIIAQFLSESILLAAIALVVSIGLVYMLIPSVSGLIDRPLTLDPFTQPWLILGLSVLVVVVGMIAGSYPAFVMSKLRTVDVLKGRLARGRGRTTVQRFLVGVQFAASIALVAASIVIYQQLRFATTADAGFQREHILTVQMPDLDAIQKADVFRQEVAANPEVLAVAISGYLPIEVGSSTTLRVPRESGAEEMVQFYHTTIGYDFLDVYGIPLVEGRAPSREMPSDTTDGYLINETAMKALGWETAVGKSLPGDRRVIGVVKDFHLHSFHQPIQPLLLQADPEMAGYVSMRVRDVESAVAAAREAFGKITRHPFQYQFLDDAYEDLYRSEIRLGTLLGWLTGLALLIASLGLFGLAAFAAEERTKEIVVRKVLGASIGQIVMLLGKEFTILVGIAGLVALPIAYVVMDRWLDDFAYRIHPGPLTLILSVLAALAAAWLSVSYQSVKAARVNPAVSLRQE